MDRRVNMKPKLTRSAIQFGFSLRRICLKSPESGVNSTASAGLARKLHWTGRAFHAREVERGGSSITRSVLLFGALILAVAVTLVLPYASIQVGGVMLNTSASVPTGLYRAAASEHASYVSFCLRRKHRVFRFYPRYCSPDRPEGRQILKRITERRADGVLYVRGDLPNAIDSLILGHIRPDQQRGFWTPLWIWGEM